MKRKRALMPRKAPIGADKFNNNFSSINGISSNSSNKIIKSNKNISNKMFKQQTQKFFIYFFLFIFLCLPSVVVCDDNNGDNGYNPDSTTENGGKSIWSSYWSTFIYRRVYVYASAFVFSISNFNFIQFWFLFPINKG